MAVTLLQFWQQQLGIHQAAQAAALDAAEDTDASALGGAALADRHTDHCAGEIALGRNRFAAARASAASRLSSAIRGVSY